MRRTSKNEELAGPEEEEKKEQPQEHKTPNGVDETAVA